MAAPDSGISSLYVDKINFFKHVMEGDWGSILSQYYSDPDTHLLKITWLGDTALHVAVAEGLDDIVKSLLELILEAPDPMVKPLLEKILKTQDHEPGPEEMNWTQTVLRVKNKDGNTPLHIAASIGSAAMCKEIAQHDPSLVSVRNEAGETPLFLAAHHGHADAFLYLVSTSGKEAGICCRRKDGNTVLHSAIFRQYFNLVFQIICLFPELVESTDEGGETPLQILARKPSAFKSGSKIGGWNWDTLIYNCIIVDQLKKATTYSIEEERSPNDSHKTENQSTWLTCFRFLRKIFVDPEAQAYRHSKPDIEVPKEQDTVSRKEEIPRGINKKIPPNCDSCVLFFKSTMKVLLVILGVGKLEIPKLVKHMHKLMLVVLGMGYARVNRLTLLKEEHTWTVQVMHELIKRSNMYAYDKGGEMVDTEISTLNFNEVFREPTAKDKFPSTTATKLETPLLITAKNGIIEIEELTTKDKLSSPTATKLETPLLIAAKNGIIEIEELTTKDKLSSPTATKLETPLLIAAKNGITEIAVAILEKFPVAVNDMDVNKKNIVLLAVETRQLNLYKKLLESYSPYSIPSSRHCLASPMSDRNFNQEDEKPARLQVNDHAFRMVDDKGNSALHLAANRIKNHKLWPIPGAALQMQWEIKWYKFIENSMPPNFFIRYNKEGENPENIFTNTHEELVKEGGLWLTKTSESCSVVAALIATVAFATSTSIPGGINDLNGKPNLENQFAFKMFGITSLVSLSFSITSLAMFLSILTSRFQEKDFGRSLPWKLLLGLTSLFLSIASMLVSFCSGHFFVLGDMLKYAAFPVYAFTCLPITFFAVA